MKVTNWSVKGIPKCPDNEHTDWYAKYSQEGIRGNPQETRQG